MSKYIKYIEESTWCTLYIFLLSSPRARSLAPTPHTRRLANGIFCACTFILRHLSLELRALEIFAYEILAFAPERCFAANRTGQFNDPLTNILDYSAAWRSILCQVALCAAKKCSGDSHHTFDAGFCGEKREKWNFAMKLWSWEWKGAKLRHIFVRVKRDLVCNWVKKVWKTLGI